MIYRIIDAITGSNSLDSIRSFDNLILSKLSEKLKEDARQELRKILNDL